MDITVPLEGSSRTTGGISRGKALGNVFNLADASDLTLNTPEKGIVKVHEVLVENPDECGPKMVLRLGVCHTLGPVLDKLGKQLPYVKGIFMQ